jgi:hypothetical protein
MSYLHTAARRLFVAVSTFSLASAAQAEPMLAVPGKVLFESKLDSAPAAPWRAAKGKWEPVEGALRGSELAADKHGAVLRVGQKLSDFIIELEVKLDGARTTTLSINAEKDHMARVSITPTLVTVQRDDNDHEGPDKAIVFHRVKADITPGTWHKVRIEMVGNTMLGQVDGITGWGESDLFTQPKANPGVTVGGESVHFRNFRIWEATKNPDWEKVKAGIKNEVQPAAKPKGKGKKKKAEE